MSSPDNPIDLYFQSVVLLCEHSEAGSFGLMINKPCHIETVDKRSTIKNLNHPKIQYRFGGALEQHQIMLLHTSPSYPGSTFSLLDKVYLGGDMQTLSKILHEEEAREVFLCFGYTGWEANTLEKQVEESLWLKYPGSSDLIFKTESTKLWSTILYEMGGKYKTLSQMPQDLSQN